jgi:hypothetical protein
VRDQLLAVVDRYPSLSVRDDPFTHNDGRSTHLLRADGTIPIFYQGVKYNIPLKMFLPEGRGLHSSTSQLNLGAFYGIGGARRGRVARAKGVLGRV